jgi:D-serine deaminase-like pyridoxal phosphate-dependent protein
MRVADLDTPILLVDVSRMERNIRGMAEFALDAGVKLRPHVKTHKIPALAHMQLGAGASGITVAKVGEAEVMADAGVADILVCYPIIGKEKLERLAHLARRARITVAIDSFEAARQLSEAAGRARVLFDLFLEVDSGLHRCGLPPGDPVVDLARQVLRLDGLEIAGVCTHAGHAIRATTAADRDAIARHEGESVTFTHDRLQAAGIRVREVSVGSSATVRVSGRVPGVTEIRPGTYIFNDYMQATAGSCSEDDCALTVLSTVVSRPSPDRAILDAGSKCLSSDFHHMTERMSGYGYIKGRRGTMVAWLSEEHGVVHLTTGDSPLTIGDRVEIIPNHACAALNLWDVLHGVRDGEVEAVWPVLARGKVR